MKKITNEMAILIIVLLLSLVNSCQTCNLKNQSVQADRTFKKSIDSLEKAIDLKNVAILQLITDKAEMIIIIENEIDNQKLKSSEIKKLIKTY